MTEPLVVLDNVVKRFGEAVAVERMNLEISRGEFLAIMGSSGCGKTTTLRMLAGLEQPSEGEIRLEGKRINDLPPWERDTPLVWQSLALFPFLSVVENVEFGLRMRGIPAAERRRRALDWLERMGLAEFAGRDVSKLSGGQRQRVALARSLVTEPQILLLDEPLSALDAHLKVRMQSLLANLQKELGITFVYVTHSQSEAFSMADRVVIMSRGRIEQIGAPKDIYRTPRNRFVAEFLGSANIFAGKVVEHEGPFVLVDTPHGRFRVPSDRDGSLRLGAEIGFTVADDRVTLSAAPPPKELNHVVGRVIGEEFIGATAMIHLEAQAGGELKAQRGHEELAALEIAPGATLYAAWRPESGHIMPGG